MGSRGNHQVLELALPHPRDAADVPEIEDRDVRPVGKQEVPRLGVGVIERIPEDHLEVHVGGATHERVDVPSRRLDAGAVGERRARDQAHREDSSPRQLGIRRRDDDVGFVGEVQREALEVAQLLRQVDGVVQHLRELADDHRGSQLREPGILVLEVRRDGLHELEILEDTVLHAVVEHLHRHRRPVMQCRPVNLRDRPRRHRLRVERAVEIRHGGAQLAFNQRLRDTRWIRARPSPAASSAPRRRHRRRHPVAGSTSART